MLAQILDGLRKVDQMRDDIDRIFRLFIELVIENELQKERVEFKIEECTWYVEFDQKSAYIRCFEKKGAAKSRLVLAYHESINQKLLAYPDVERVFGQMDAFVHQMFLHFPGLHLPLNAILQIAEIAEAS